MIKTTHKPNKHSNIETRVMNWYMSKVTKFISNSDILLQPILKLILCLFIPVTFYCSLTILGCALLLIIVKSICFMAALAV